MWEKTRCCWSWQTFGLMFNLKVNPDKTFFLSKNLPQDWFGNLFHLKFYLSFRNEVLKLGHENMWGENKVAVKLLTAFLWVKSLIVFLPAGMVLSVFLVLLLTVFFEILKVWRVWLSSSSNLAQPPQALANDAPPSGRTESCSALDPSPSESSLTPTESQPQSPRSRWE